MNRLIAIAVLIIYMTTPLLAQEISRHNAEELLLAVEKNPSLFQAAKRLAVERGQPIAISLLGAFMYPIVVHDNRPLYVIITNLAHPFDGALTGFYEDISQRYDLRKARMKFGTPQSQRRENEDPHDKQLSGTSLLLVPDWTADRVWAFDPQTGNLVDTAFIRSNSTALDSPKEALLHPVHNFITVSDQIRDLVQKFNPLDGTWLGWFAPSTGVNNAILDNIRGHAYRPNNNLLVTVASGANAHAIAEFDTGGNYLGNFIGVGVGGLNSPFAILYRENDILISQSSTPTGVKSYDFNGNYLGQWASITNFPQQMFRLADGRIAVANFSGTGSTGIRLYTADGTFIRLLAGVTGNRGVYQLPNGNFLTTNSTGLHEIDSTTGNLVRTIQAGANFQYITLYAPRTVSVPERQKTLPSVFSLSQNYPNPFNPITTFTLGLPQGAYVSVKVYDLTGREVMSLIEEVLSAGYHQVSLDGSGLASGIYVCRMVARPTDAAASFASVHARKVVLIK
jgi:hypothetical protein